MIDYKDPVSPIVGFYVNRVECNVFGNRFPQTPDLPALLVKSAGGVGFSRIQLTYRTESDDIAAMTGLIEAMNLLERYAAQIDGLRVVWCERESNPVPSVDQDTNHPEAWCYMRLNHLEA